MKTTLPRFYIIFLLSALVLFSFEDKGVNRKATRQRMENRSELKESENRDNKEEKSVKRPFKHYYRYSNLC